MIHIGVDPGLQGAVAILDGNLLIEIRDMPTNTIDRDIVDSDGFGDIIQEYKTVPHHVHLEKLHSWGRAEKMSKVSLWSFALGYGMICDRVKSMRMTHSFWEAKAWQKGVHALTGKDGNCLRALQLFPNAPIKGPKGALLDGRADALLIAYYGYTMIELGVNK